MSQEERRLYLIKYLLAERSEYTEIKIPKGEKMQKELLRALLNVREVHPVSEEFLAVQDRYLQTELLQKGITDCEDLEALQEHIYLWRGDITTLKADAIVNAANSQLLGCFSPNHACIDNAIHTFSGVQLRQKCYELMKAQGHLEKTGQAKISPAYNLPSQYVIHTVGPVVRDQLTEKEVKQLMSSYLSCLQIAQEHQLNSLAFCCISTGEFHFPYKEAAQIAISTVQHFLKETESQMKVVFNVFKEEDDRLYKRLLKGVSD